MPAAGRPLWPFLLIATVIVVAIGAVAFAFGHGSADLRITGKVVGTPTPTAERPDAPGTGPGQTAFVASGSWVLSSLPACLFEQDHRYGKLADLRASLPAEADRVLPGATLHYGDCTLVVRPHEVWISRGSDRLRVPPEARLYRHGERLTLVFSDGPHVELRHYCRRFDPVRCPAQSFPSPRRMISV